MGSTGKAKRRRIDDRKELVQPSCHEGVPGVRDPPAAKGSRTSCETLVVSAGSAGNPHVPEAKQPCGDQTVKGVEKLVVDQQEEDLGEAVCSKAPFGERVSLTDVGEPADGFIHANTIRQCAVGGVVPELSHAQHRDDALFSCEGLDEEGDAADCGVSVARDVDGTAAGVATDSATLVVSGGTLNVCERSGEGAPSELGFEVEVFGAVAQMSPGGVRAKRGRCRRKRRSVPSKAPVTSHFGGVAVVNGEGVPSKRQRCSLTPRRTGFGRASECQGHWCGRPRRRLMLMAIAHRQLDKETCCLADVGA